MIFDYCKVVNVSQVAVHQTIIGSTLEETAYHEAGHIVVAAACGLELKAQGITVYEVAPNVGDGYACYWDHPLDWDKNLQAVLAGQFAQYLKFPKSDFTGSKCDNDYFFDVVKKHFPESIPSNIWDSVRQRTYPLLESYWDAVVEISETLIASSSVPEDQHPVAKRKKQLDGARLVSILSSHSLNAVVRQ